jgi:hypothetical protein
MSYFEDVREHLSREKQKLNEAINHLNSLEQAERDFGLSAAKRSLAVNAQKALHACGKDCPVSTFTGTFRPAPEPEIAVETPA